MYVLFPQAAGGDGIVADDELEVRLKSAARIIELQDKLTARNDFLEYAYSNLTTDLKIAAKVQEDLLPRQFRLAGLDTNWVFKPANFNPRLNPAYPVNNDSSFILSLLLVCNRTFQKLH